MARRKRVDNRQKPIQSKYLIRKKNYLLHFNFYNTPIDRDTANKKLKHFMSNYKKRDPSHYNQLKDKLDTAIKNAKKLDCKENCDEVKNARKNPVTTVYRLINKFRN